jgi:hypothetical protein
MEYQKKKSVFAAVVDKMRGKEDEPKELSYEQKKKNLDDLGVDEAEYDKFRKVLTKGKG